MGKSAWQVSRKREPEPEERAEIGRPSRYRQPDDYADYIRRNEARSKRFRPRELARMRDEARALLHLGETGWLPDATKRDDYFKRKGVTR